MNERILLTAFRGTSSELLLHDCGCDTLLLPSHRVKDAEMLVSALENRDYTYIFSFGQRPNIKNKVHIETTARNGERWIDTDFHVENLRELFEKQGIPAKISHNAGTSYCNSIYWNGLFHITEQNLQAKMVFIHVPFAKNIVNMQAFKEGILKTIFEITTANEA